MYLSSLIRLFKRGVGLGTLSNYHFRSQQHQPPFSAAASLESQGIVVQHGSVLIMWQLLMLSCLSYMCLDSYSVSCPFSISHCYFRIVSCGDLGI